MFCTFIYLLYNELNEAQLCDRDNLCIGISKYPAILYPPVIPNRNYPALCITYPPCGQILDKSAHQNINVKENIQYCTVEEYIIPNNKHNNKKLTINKGLLINLSGPLILLLLLFFIYSQLSLFTVSSLLLHMYNYIRHFFILLVQKRKKTQYGTW